LREHQTDVTGKNQRTVACPACGKPALFSPENEWRPFCSERCRMVDLGGWASESYKIPTKPADDDSSPESG
jgi:endogenous inhibitor of DNA gyrase (YacG/DUF329 family)